MRRLALLAALLLSLAACGGSRDAVDIGSSGSSAAAPPEGTWVLTTSVPDVGVPDDTRATLRLGPPDGRTMDAGGDTPCNAFGGEATSAADGTWTWQLTAVTEMGCEAPRTAGQEAYLAALAATTTWSLTADGLQLDGNGVELGFTLQEPVPTAELVGTDWLLDGTVDGDTISTPPWASTVGEAILRLDGNGDGGTFVLFSGCRDFDGEWTTDGDTVRWPIWGQSEESRDVDACNPSELESEALVLAAVEGGFTVELGAQEFGTFLTIRSTQHSAAGLRFRGPQVDVAAGPTDPDGAVPGPEPVCFSIMAMSTDGDGAASRDAAMNELVTTGAGWWTPPPGTTFDGTTIVFDGEEIGEASLFQFDNGTWAVNGIDVCYPPGTEP